MKKLYFFVAGLIIISAQSFSQNVNVSGALVGNGTYATLSAAFTAINGGAQTGATILVDIAGNTTETSSAVLNQSVGPWASLTITPSGGSRSITANIAAVLIYLNGADNVTINGGPGKLLTIDNSNTANAACTILFVSDACNNTISQTNIYGSGGITSSSGSVISFGGTSLTTGNDNNTISSCNIGASSGGTPTNAIYSGGSLSNKDNSGNTITDCNISDYFRAIRPTCGILIGVNNSGWTVTNNRLYQTATRTYTIPDTHYGIQVLTGSGYNISNNVIGFANSSGTGTTNMIGLSSGSMGGTFPVSYTPGPSTNATQYVGIYCTSGTVPSSIQNNTIAGFAIYTSSSGSIFTGIEMINSGPDNVVSGNTIGSLTGNGSIYTATEASGGAVVGISIYNNNSTTITNNNIGAIDAMGSSVNHSGSIVGINVTGAGNFNIYSNTIGNTTIANLRMGNLTTGANLSNVGTTFGIANGGGSFRGIQNTSTGTVNIGLLASPNIIRNAQLNSVNAGTATILRGIDCNSGHTGIPTITYNTISNLSAAVTNTNLASGSLAALGIYLSQAYQAVVSNNTITGLNLTNTGTGGYNLAGISFTGINGSITVAKNKIYNLGNASTSASITAPSTAAGIFISDGSGAVTDISNNMISLGNSKTTNTSFIGIWAQNGLAAATTGKIYHNTINIEGTAVSGAQPSFGFLRGDFSATANTVFKVDMKNCIITNSRTGGTGKHYALANSYGATASAIEWGINASNYNLLNAATATVGYWSGDRTFANWKTISASDINSLSGYPATFTNSATGDLHINMGVTPNVIESGGTTGLGIAVDYDNDARPGPTGSVNGGALAPDLGADEFDGVILDIVPPIIIYTPLVNIACITNRTFTVTITDFISGVNNTIGTRPRVYYKRSTDGNVWNDNTNGSDGWKYTEASNAANPFSLTVNYSLLNGGTGVSTGQIVEYFVVAQDMAVTPNVGINNGTFSSTPSTVALTTTAFPLTGIINSYNITTAIATSVTIGALGTYTSLTGAGGLFEDINNRGLSGNTVATIIDATVTETGANALTQMGTDCSAASYTLTIKPNTAGTLLTGTLAGGALIKIKSSNVIIDGSSNGTASQDLTITNLSVTAPAVLLLGSTGTLPVSNVILKNCIIINGVNSSNVLVVSDGSTIGNGGYFNNITIQNNNIQRSYTGIYSSAIPVSGNGNGLLIKSNTLNTIGANAIRSVGIYVSGVDGATVADNDIGNFESSTAETDHGIWFAAGTTNSVIERNKIHDLQYTGNLGYGNKGISLNTGLAAANVSVQNNMVSGITGDGNSYLTYGAKYSPVGIYVFGSGQGGVNIYYNSINLYGATLNPDLDTYSIGIALDHNSKARIVNNIIRNTMEATGPGFNIGAGGIAAFTSASQFTELDYNDYYSVSSIIGNIGGQFRASLASWQSLSGKDANSLNVQPNFTSLSDLHLVAGNNCRLDGYGTPIAGITTDYDVQTRDAGAPDMGADEFTTTPPFTMTTASNCDTKNVSPSGTLFIDASCNLTAKVLPSGGAAVMGKIKTCATLDATQQYYNGQPYVQRHYDIEPSVNSSTATGTITLYFTNAEFVAYNTNNPLWPPLPTSALGNSDPNRANVKVTQFHGAATTSPSSPGNYPGTKILINPTLPNVYFNGTYWEISFDVTGFSGFYVHSNFSNTPLPIIINYFTGRKQGSNHLLNWKVTCISTPRVTMILERSADSRNFTGINSITADAVRCDQPFDYTDTDPLKGMNYYRLKMADADGKVSYSSIVALLNAVKGFDIISIAPNPVVTGNFKLNVASAQAGKMDIAIFDVQGRLVNRQTITVIAGFNSLPVHVGNLSSGTYTIRANMAGEQSRVIRFVKQ